MARNTINIGVSGNDGTGDSIREAFRKTNDNFEDLYARVLDSQRLPHMRIACYFAGDSQTYEVGTIMVFGGVYEVTASASENAAAIAGVITTGATSVTLNSSQPVNPVCVATHGRVPVKVLGNVSVGDKIIASVLPGVGTVAQANMPYSTVEVVGIAMTNKTTADVGLVEIFVK